jgi:hypothetical protein
VCSFNLALDNAMQGTITGSYARSMNRYQAEAIRADIPGDDMKTFLGV